MRPKARFELLAVYIVFFAVVLLSYSFQQPISINKGIGWDGFTYYRVAEQIAAGRAPEGQPAFIYRLGTPFLAALANRGNLLSAFLAVNLAASALLPVLLIVWLRPHVPSWLVRVGVTSVFLVAWQAPPRYTFFYPTMSDPWAVVFVIAGMICVDRSAAWPRARAIGVVSALTFVGVFFRETTLLIAVAFLFTGNPIKFDSSALFFFRLKRRPAWAAFLPLAFGVAAVLATHHIARPAPWADKYSYLENLVQYVFKKSPLTFLQGLFNLFGPVLAVVFFDWRDSLAFLRRHQHQAVFLVLAAVLAWLAGTDTERYGMNMAPVVLVLAGQAILRQRRVLASPWLIAVLAISQAVAERVFWVIPDPSIARHVFPILTPPSSKAAYLDLFAYFRPYSEAGGLTDVTRIKVAVISCLEWFALVCGLLFWMRLRARALAVRPHEGDARAASAAT
jgi:hypothetical protein